MTFRAALEHALRDLGLPPDPAVLDRLAIHARLLQEWNPVAALVSAGAAHGEALHRHYLDSIRALPHLTGTGRAADLGSGAGFPGLIWAALRPALHVTVIESSRRKAAFLRQAAHEMELPCVQVQGSRVETEDDLASLGADLLTTRSTGCADLLLAAARLSASPVRVMLFLSAGAAAVLHAAPPVGFRQVVATSLPQGGQILVLERDVPRGTS